MSESTSIYPLAAVGSFANRTVVITGGAGTVGRPLSLALAKAGANVVINDLGTSPHHATAGSPSSDPVATLVEEITSLGLSAVASTHNVITSPDTIIDLAIKTFGSIHAVINCVGIHRFMPFEDHDADVCRQTLETNILGPMLVIRAAWPHFKKQGFGRVVNFTSDSLFGMENSLAYVASKGALFGITRSLSLEGKPFGISVNACAPVAYPPMVMAALDALPQEQLDYYKKTFTAESNISMIMALASKECDVTGEVFEVGAWAAGRMVLGTTKGVAGLRTIEQCLQKISGMTTKGTMVEVFEPKDVADYLGFKAGYI